MASAWALTRARERIAALGAAGLDDRDLRRQVLAALREVIDFGAYVWLLTDPVTAVGAAPLAEVPCMTELPALIKAKYATSVNRWTALQRQVSPAGLLYDATSGDLSRSRVWREVMSRYGIVDVASVVFADQYGCWGFLDLWRDGSREPFGGADAEFIASLAASLTGALRHSQARTFVEPSTPHRSDAGPVVLMLDYGLQITSRTAASQAWLQVLLPPEPDERAIPVRAARLSSGERPDAAAERGPTLVVTIEEASAAERLDLFGRSFGLTAREHELLGLLAAGVGTRAMARQMSLSEHTIQDHLKSIFAKTGARDRVTVLSRALGTRREANRSAENSS